MTDLPRDVRPPWSFGSSSLPPSILRIQGRHAANRSSLMSIRSCDDLGKLVPRMRPMNPAPVGAVLGAHLAPDPAPAECGRVRQDQEGDEENTHVPGGVT